MKNLKPCYIGLGSNIGDSKTIVKESLQLLSQLPKTQLRQASPLYLSEAVSDVAQDPYINAAAYLVTELKPHELLLELQAIESAYYRMREQETKWGPRTLDLDILLYANERIQDSHLTIPHPELQNRLFVLMPLRDIMGDVYLAGLGSLSYLIEQAPKYAIKKLDD